jgi:hypothetical protein
MVLYDSRSNTTYNFDEDGKLVFDAEITKDDVKEDGKTLTVYGYPDGDWDTWSAAKPFSRGYDKNGRLVFRMVGYEDRTDIEYNSDGTVAKTSWAAESWSGEDAYTYSKVGGLNRRVECVSSVSEFEGEAEYSSVQYVAFVFDFYGNWVRRFVVSKEGESYSATIEMRDVFYYDDAEEGDFQNLNDQIFTGKIGGSEAGLCLIDNSNGYFFYKSGNNVITRKFQVTSYDEDTEDLTFSATYFNGKPVGEFEGTLSGGELSGTFTNTSGNSVEMSFDQI